MSEKPDLSEEVLLPNGKMIDKYQIVKLIGFGGMGAVYLAIDTDNEYDNAYVALKILYPKLARKSGDFTRRFLREARIASRIEHPNLVQVFECNFSDENGFYYLAQEYVGGGSLRQLVSNDTVLSEIEALRVAIGVSQALGAVNEHKVVHRDIKPDNIMFTTDGTVKLTDWGIAKQKNFSNAAALAQLELTVNKVFMGTPLYASPEQIQDSRNVDIRSDIYSLGATIYYSLVGKPPFRGTTEVDSLCAVLTKPAPDVRKARPDISDKLAELLLRMLAKSPGERPANPVILLELLLDAGKKYHLREHMGISGIHSSGGVRESVSGQPGRVPGPSAYQPTEATRRPVPGLAPESVLQPTTGSNPELQRNAKPADESVAPSEYCPEAGFAGASQEESSSVTEGTLIAEKHVVQPVRSPGTRSGGAGNPAPSRTVSVEEGAKALSSARVPSMAVTWMIYIILLLAAVLFAGEQWVDLKVPEKRFLHCMELGDEALQRQSWQAGMFYFRGASHVAGFENDRRPDQGIVRAKRGVQFEQKTAKALQVLHQETDKSKIDWKAAHTLFSAALTTEGYQQNIQVLQKVDYCRHGMQYAAFFHSGIQAAENKQWQSAVENFVKAMRVPGFEKDCEAQELLQIARNNQRFQELLTQGQQACQAADRSGAVDDWNKAVDSLISAMSISGISKEDVAVAGKALQNAEAGLLRVQRNDLEQLFTLIEDALGERNYFQAVDLVKTIRQTSFVSKEDLVRADALAAKIAASRLADERAAKFQTLYEAGNAAFKQKDYRQAGKLFSEALSIPGYHEDTKVLTGLSEVFKAQIEQAQDQITPVDLAKNLLDDAEQIPKITREQRQTVIKIRGEILRTEAARREGELRGKYNSLVDEAGKLLTGAKSLADYDEVERRYQEAIQYAVADQSEAVSGLQKCRRQRNVFLFRAGDEFADSKNWPCAMDCYQKILFGVFSDSGDRKKAEGKIQACRLSELTQLLDKGQEALQREDWQDAEDACRQAADKAAGDFPTENGRALQGLSDARNGLDFQRHFGDGISQLNAKKYREAVAVFDLALKIPGFKKHPGALKNRQDAQLRADEEQKAADLRVAEAKKTAARNRFEELIAEAGHLLQDGQFAASEMKFTEAGKVPGYVQDQRVKEGIDKCSNGLRIQALKRDLDGAMQREDWHTAEKILLDMLLLPGYQDDPELQRQLKNVRDRMFQKYATRGKDFFADQHWEKAAEEFQKALLVEGYEKHPEVQGYLDQAREMGKWLVRIRNAENDFRKVLASLQKEKYFRTGAMKQDYVIELKNVWTEVCGCPVESIRQKRQEVLWREKVLPGLNQVSEALLYHPPVLSLTDELQAQARRDFLEVIAEVDGICQDRVCSLDEKSELRINVTKFFLLDYFHPALVERPIDLSEDPRRIGWLAKLFR